MTHSTKPVLAQLATGTLPTEHGDFEMSVFHDGLEEAVVLTRGQLAGQETVLCRIHSACLSGHYFSGTTCDCQDQMSDSLRRIARDDCGLVILLNQEGRGCGAAAHAATLNLKRDGVPQPQAYEMVGFPEDMRRYDIAAKIILHLGIRSVILISSNLDKLHALRKWGVHVAGAKEAGTFFYLGSRAENRVAFIKAGKQRPVIEKGGKGPWVLVVGDLNADYIISANTLASSAILIKPQPVVGGTAFNAAVAFKRQSFNPVLFGGVGDDSHGKMILAKLETEAIPSLLRINKEKNTGVSQLLYAEDTGQRWLIQEEVNANDYNSEDLEQALDMTQLGAGSLAFVVGHAFARQGGPAHGKRLLEQISGRGLSTILDVVPHNMYERVGPSEFQDAINGRVDVLIGEYVTLMRLASDQELVRRTPSSDDLDVLMNAFQVNSLVVRYGIGNIEWQVICCRADALDLTPDPTVLSCSDDGSGDISPSRRDLMVELRKILSDRFNLSDLRTLCFDMGVDFDNIGGETKDDKICAFLEDASRHRRIPLLITTGRELRKDVTWPLLRTHRVIERKRTGYSEKSAAERRGFGDLLTAELLRTHFNEFVNLIWPRCVGLKWPHLFVLGWFIRGPAGCGCGRAGRSWCRSR